MTTTMTNDIAVSSAAVQHPAYQLYPGLFFTLPANSLTVIKYCVVFVAVFRFLTFQFLGTLGVCMQVRDYLEFFSVCNGEENEKNAYSGT